MKTTIKHIKDNINLLPPEFLELISLYIEKTSTIKRFGVEDFQIDEVKTRLEFHKENPKTRLDFLENIKDLEKLLY